MLNVRIPMGVPLQCEHQFFEHFTSIVNVFYDLTAWGRSALIV